MMRPEDQCRCDPEQLEKVNRPRASLGWISEHVLAGVHVWYVEIGHGGRSPSGVVQAG